MSTPQDAQGPPDVEAMIPLPPSWLKSRARALVNNLGSLAFTVLTAGHARWKAPFQLRLTFHPMPMPNLPPALEGFRIVQFSDLHTLRNTPLDYLRDIVRRINGLRPDFVAVTGDLVTHNVEAVKPAADLIAAIEAPRAVIFGNHDYSANWQTSGAPIVAEALQAALAERGIPVLRNRSMSIEHRGARLWIAGAEDLWTRRFDAAATVRDVPPGEPLVVLSHNPDTIHSFAPLGVPWVLSGHTHGGQIRVPVAGSVVLPVRDKRLDMGYFCFGRTRLYISRGVGSHQRVRFRCDPELPCFTLTRDEERP